MSPEPTADEPSPLLNPLLARGLARLPAHPGTAAGKAATTDRVLRRLVVLLALSFGAALFGGAGGGSGPGAIVVTVVLLVAASAPAALIAFHPSTARWLAVPVALVMGLAVGVAAGAVPLVGTAVVLAAVVVVTRLVWSAAGVPPLGRGAGTALVGLLSLELLSAAGVQLPSLTTSGPWVALAVLAIAGLTAAICEVDVAAVRTGVEEGAPAGGAWLAAVGLLVTPVWVLLVPPRVLLDLLGLLEPVVAVARLALGAAAGLAALFDV